MDNLKLKIAGEQGELIQKVFTQALDNVLKVNTVICDKKIYNKAGLIKENKPFMIRAGGDYENPWTRDATINTWNAVNLLNPNIAQNTLLAVCEKDSEDNLIVQDDNQWWDKIIWITGAYEYYLVTGDKEFLENAFLISKNTMDILIKERFNEEFDLFKGPSFFNDGIAGYPLDLHEEGNISSFVLDHKRTHEMMALSTNCIYYHGLILLDKIATILEKKIKDDYLVLAKKIKNSINTKMYIKEKGLFGYFIYGEGENKGKLDTSVEAMGHAFAIDFQIADNLKIESILKNLPKMPKGICSIYPHFEGLFTDEKQGRHNAIIWPFINGYFGEVAAKHGHIEILTRELIGMAELVEHSHGEFYEIYHSITGKVDGGIQCGHSWDSCHHQTWSASAFIRMVLNGVIGITFIEEGIVFKPSVDQSLAGIIIENIRYREMTLSIELMGYGNKIKSFEINNTVCDQYFISNGLSGEYFIKITLMEE